MTPYALMYYTAEEYLAFERDALERHEYYKGEIRAVPGGSLKHNMIEDNIRGDIGSYIRGTCCRSLGINCRIHIPQNTLYTYPDILIVCGEPQFADDQFDTLLNPSVLIEILSPSTGNYDRGAKFNLCREIETLKEYLLIDSAGIHVVHYTRNEDGTWTLWESKKVEDSFQIATIGLQLALSDLYAGV